MASAMDLLPHRLRWYHRDGKTLSPRLAVYKKQEY